MTPEDKAYYSDGYQPLFKLMSEEFGLTLLEQDMSEIMNCVRKMDEASTITRLIALPVNELIDVIMEGRIEHIGILTGNDIGLVVGYYDYEAKTIKRKTIGTKPSY